MMKTKTKVPQASRSLATTLAIAFFTLSVFILLVSGSVALYANILAYQDRLSNEQHYLAKDAGETVSSFIDDKFTALETVIEFANPISAMPEVRKAMLESLLGLDPAFQQFALLDINGRQLTQISRLSQGLSPQFTLQLENAALSQDRRYIGSIYIDNATSEPLIAMGIPVKNVFGDFQGTMVTEINLKFIWELVDQLEAGNTGYAYVVDDQGNLIAFGDTARVLRGENVKHLREVQEFIENPSLAVDLTPEIVSYIGLTGEKVVGSYVPLGTPRWAVFVEIPYSEAYGPIFRTAAGTVIATLITAIL